jgi:hypothetical protein
VFKPQSGTEEAPDTINDRELDAPQQEDSDALGTWTSNHARVNSVFTGEAIQSFRTLLKRYNLHTAFIWYPDANAKIFSGNRPMFPYLRGNVGNPSIDSTSAGVSYNFCNTVLMHWVTYAFQGWRGSIRWKLLPRGELSIQRRPIYYIERNVGDGFVYDENVFVSPGQITILSEVRSQTVNQIDLTAPQSGAKGLVYTPGWINPVCEFEMPFYSADRFYPGKREDNFNVNRSPEGWWSYRIYGDGFDDTVIDSWVAAGEDFQVYFFTGLPPMYYEPVPPTPAT